MFSMVRRRLSYANIVVTVALVFLMTGGAYAASKFVITSTKQIKPSVLKSLQGKAGKSGAPGVQGPAGVAGPVGPAGSAGAAGIKGEAGSNGTSVTSVESKTKIGSCKEGGSEFKTAGGTTFACNGEKGSEGTPGTFEGKPLPKGKSLKGVWAASGFGKAQFPSPGYGVADVGVSFATPVSPALTLSQQHYVGPKEGEGEENEAEVIKKGECTGTAVNPGAAEGNLCVFGQSETNLLAQPGPIPIGSGVTLGFTLLGLGLAEGAIYMNGTWAVTA